MIDTSAILDVLETTMTSHLDGSDERELLSKIKTIRAKRKDSKLYLAVVGEFSSGKSTFINALLGFRLLKEAVMPTTACATYIQNKGKELMIEVVFFDGRQYLATSDDFESLAEYINLAFEKNYHGMDAIIEALTSDQDVAKSVKSLKINLPNAKIPKNVVIIDTPGFNPGSSSVDNHYEITKNVVENIADVALILTPQEQAMSATLISFLTKTLSRCLHRCVYVITKMDVLPSEYRSDVYDFVKQRIEADLGVRDPKLYAESAITMLPVKCIPRNKIAEWAYYRQQFADFESETWETLQRSKNAVLSEHVHILVHDVITRCVEKLNEKEIGLKKEKEFLEAHSIKNIKDVCDKMVLSSCRAINEALDGIPTSVSYAESTSKTAAEKIIATGIMSLENFKTEKMPQIKQAVETEAQKVLSDINSQMNYKVMSCVENQIRKMSVEFASHYDSFPSLKPSQSPPQTDLVRFKTPNMSFDIALAKIEALDAKENKSMGWGAVLGGIVGFMIGGPFGAVGGAALGAGGGVMAGDQSDNMKASATPVVKNEIASFFTSLRVKIDNEIASVRSNYIDLVKQFAADHVTKYGGAVNTMIKNRQAQIDRLNDQIRNLKNAIENLRCIQDDISQELAYLKLKK